MKDNVILSGLQKTNDDIDREVSSMLTAIDNAKKDLASAIEMFVGKKKTLAAKKKHIETAIQSMKKFDKVDKVEE